MKKCQRSSKREVKMRKSCLECVLKHLGSAAVYIEEVQMGYPNYFGFVYGQLDHAASECIEEIPDLAWAIREHRIKWAETRKSDKPHRIPFEAMFDYIDTVEEAGDVVEVPKGIYCGLEIAPDGRPVFSMDTRPEDEEERVPPVANPGSVFAIADAGDSPDRTPLNHSTPN